MVLARSVVCSFRGVFHRVHWVQVVRSCPSLWVCSVPLPCLLPSFLLCFTALPFKYALFRVLRAFLARFGVRMYVCTG